MDLSLIIAQLRQYAPVFQNRVGGAADYANALDAAKQANMSLPAAYVIPLDDSAEPNELQNGLRQEVTERVGVIVETDASADRRGQAAALGVEGMKYAVHTALLNWRIDPIRAQRGLEYAGGRLVHFDAARLFWQFEYELVVTIMDEDGFVVDGVPIQSIDMQFGDGTNTIDAKILINDVAVSASLPLPSASVEADFT